MQENCMQRLINIVAKLRGKGGCPWDREQTLGSMKDCLIEECYEVIDAIESGNPNRHKEELGDLLLQIVFQSQIRKEEEEFTFDDVVAHICTKLIRRHPHVFGNLQVSGSREVLKNWEVIKAQERKDSVNQSQKSVRQHSIANGIPRQLPALFKARRIQERAARVGFDWAKTEDVIAKVEEEFTELKKAIKDKDSDLISSEMGDLFFAVVNLSRFQCVNAEESLNRAIDKFVRRLQEMEKRIQDDGRELRDCTLAEMDAHWEAIKETE